MKKGLMRMVATMLVIMLSVTMALGVKVEASQQGYRFKYKNATVKMHGKAKKLIKKAGKIQKKVTSKSCAYNGYDRTYLFKNFMLVTYSKSKKGAEYVNCIKFRTKKVKTREGIRIGSSKKAVMKAYGAGSSSYGVYTYNKGKSKLQIEISNDKVTAITYIAR